MEILVWEISWTMQKKAISSYKNFDRLIYCLLSHVLSWHGSLKQLGNGDPTPKSSLNLESILYYWYYWD